MTSEQIGQVIDALIPLGGGFLATLYGMRKLGKKSGVDAAYDEKMIKLGKPLKILGVLVMAFGTMQLLRALL